MQITNEPKKPQPEAYYAPQFLELYAKVAPYTMLCKEKLYANYLAIYHLVERKKDGAIVECGVWKGGSILLMLYTLKACNACHYPIWLFDTFAGMSKPTQEDTQPVQQWWQRQVCGSHNQWCYAPRTDVEALLATSGYPPHLLHFVQGDVLETIPKHLPQTIALLRLDTDWYASTWHEMCHLYPRLQKGGIVMIDDYGTWRGARQAVDRYFTNQPRPLLWKVGRGARIGIKE